MQEEKTLQRFITAQETTYARALSEITDGRKRSHWMWYIFPQIQGLGQSEMSKLYAIKDGQEAITFLQHPVLGHRLITICSALLQVNEKNATRIFGSPDDMKLKSSMTLFSSAANADPVFQLVLDKFFDGNKDEKTLMVLKKQS